MIVDGQKDAGIDPILKDLRKRASLGDAVSKAHGKIAWFSGDTDLSDYLTRQSCSQMVLKPLPVCFLRMLLTLHLNYCSLYCLGLLEPLPI